MRIQASTAFKVPATTTFQIPDPRTYSIRSMDNCVARLCVRSRTNNISSSANTFEQEPLIIT